MDLRVDLMVEGFGNINLITPGAKLRGITPYWKAKYLIVVPGKNWVKGYPWLQKNCEGKWNERIYQPQWLVGFDRKKDAMNFQMTWAAPAFDKRDDYNQCISVRLSNDNYSKAKHWCRQEFGIEGNIDKSRKWKSQWGYETGPDSNDYYFFFLKTEDATLFKLSWG